MTMFKRLAAVGLVFAATAVGSTPLFSQAFQLAPVPPDGHIIPPWFEGWYQNPDGTVTYSFGYFNRNQRDTVEIPIGPDNHIVPEQFNGMQPTSFPPGRHVGAFAVVVPDDYRGDVVWHLRTLGQDNTVPGRATSPAYQLGYQPMALGSVPPAVRLPPNGRVGRGPLGIIGEVVRGRVGTPLELSVWAVDESVRERPANMGVTWYKHQGPAPVTFTEAAEEVDAAGRARALATFAAPGDYLVRVRVDNFRAPDSTPADQCCWTNGFIRVTVEP
jgi:hypothetical protein